MIIKTEQVKLVLGNKAIPTKQLSEMIGVKQEVLDNYQAGSLSFGDLSAGVLMTIQEWIDDGNFKISYDYLELISELKDDILEGLTGENIYVVRGKWNEILGTAPIIDFFYTLEDFNSEGVKIYGDGATVQKMKTKIVLDEMERFNELF